MRAGAGAGVIALAAVLALSSCAASTGGGTPERRAQCVPQVVAVSRVVARPGDELRVSAGAAPCTVAFTADGVLTVAMRPLHGGDAEALPLTTTRAAPSGAFDEVVRLPEEATTGDWVVVVSKGLASTACDDTGGGSASCAAPEAYLRMMPAAVDWTKGSGKRKATAVVERIERDLAGSPGFLGAEILPGGVQVSLAHPFRDRTDRVIAAAGGEQPSSTRGVGEGRVPVVRFNGFTNRAELLALRARVQQDETDLLRQGIDVVDVDLDLMTSTVVAHVDDCIDAQARGLSRRYGAALAVGSRR